MVSGGNSSSIYLIEQGNLPEGINNLRLGESFLLGNDTAYGTRIPGTVGDALELEAEVIEIKEKPSLPVGEIGVDAFGHRPTYEDKGIMRRAIVAVGRQDVDTDSLQPRDPPVSYTHLDVYKRQLPFSAAPSSAGIPTWLCAPMPAAAWLPAPPGACGRRGPAIRRS